MRDLNWELKELCEENADGSFSTQDGRERTLTAFANLMAELGLTKLTLRGIKPKHIEAFVAHLQDKGLAVSTIKTQMSRVRWMADRIGKSNIVAGLNDAYGIGKRSYVTNESKARELTAIELSKVTDPYSATSLQLQAAFAGLRIAIPIGFNNQTQAGVFTEGTDCGHGAMPQNTLSRPPSPA